MIKLICLTLYSLLSITVITSPFIIMFTFFINRKAIKGKVPIWYVVVLISFILIRPLFPFEFYFSNAINSFNIMPKIDSVIKMTIITLTYKGMLNIRVLDVFWITWIIITIILFCSYFRNYYLLCNNVKNTPSINSDKVISQLESVKENYNFNFKPKIIINDGVDYPAEFGYFKQTIFIDNYNYSDKELYYILSHEMTHFNNKSNWINFFVNFVSFVFWWNPAIHLLKKYVENILEMYVDTQVTKGLSDAEKNEYMDCIYHVHKRINSVEKPVSKLVHPMAGSFSNKALLNRFEMITEDEKVNIPICISLFLVLLLYLFASTFVIQPAYEPPEKDMNIANCEFTDENSYITKEGDLYVLYYNNEPLIHSSDINKFPKIDTKQK